MESRSTFGNFVSDAWRSLTGKTPSGMEVENIKPDFSGTGETNAMSLREQLYTQGKGSYEEIDWKILSDIESDINSQAITAELRGNPISHLDQHMKIAEEAREAGVPRQSIDELLPEMLNMRAEIDAAAANAQKNISQLSPDTVKLILENGRALGENTVAMGGTAVTPTKTPDQEIDQEAERNR